MRNESTSGLNKMLDILVDPELSLDDAVTYAIFIHARLFKLPRMGTLDEIKEVAKLYQKWFAASIPITEAIQLIPEIVSGAERLQTLSSNVGEAKFYEIIENIEDFVKRWNNAASKMSIALEMKTETAHAT